MGVITNLIKDAIFYSMNIQKELLKSGQTIILALSGGPDSIYLLHQLAPLHQSGGITVIAAHLDHEWRENSANDVLFCRNAVNKLGIELVDDKLSNLNLAIKYNGSQEEIGR